ncbi:MAG TPA: carboxypeptidase-like regulatory domain-containing protein [Bryobacteraceae bacterium]|nr:carboxypeptidase-like regulatory domain-containing protein [Bryobacteraceae bacterium]
MSFPLFRLWVALGLCMAAGSQAPSAAPAPGTIAGVVFDAGNNAPIRRAVVTLSTVEARPQDAVAWTDGQGRFAFGYLPPGRYELRVSKNGYQAAVYGTDSPRRPPGIITIDAGETRGDLVFRLQLVTTITGTVTDDHGDPLPGVSVAAMRWGWQRQKRRLLPGPSAQSDAEGHYRLTNIAPGSYALVASKTGAPLAAFQSEAVAGQSQRPYYYALQYYPGTDRPESATLVSVEAGREYSNIDFQLTARSTPTVQGKIVPPPGISMFEQISIGASREDLGGRGPGFGAGVFQPDFAFHFDQLTAGSYVLVAQATAGGRSYRGVQNVEVGFNDISDLSIALQPSIDLAGSVAVEGPGAARYSPAPVSLVPGEGTAFKGPQPRAIVNKDGTFKIANVPPGVWDINPGRIPPGGYLKSMRLGDQDVLTEEMVIGPSTDVQLKIVISTQAAELQGEVSRNGQPARALVLLVPEVRYRHVLSYYRTVAADPNGHFEIKNAAPGTYALFAFEEFDRQLIEDPEFLKPFEAAGVPVTLREGENPPQKISVITPGPGVAQ